MIETIFENITMFPDWLQSALLISWGAFLFLVPIFGIVKILQSTNLKILYRSTPLFIQELGKFLQHQIDDPIKFPKVERALQYIMVFNSYFLALWLFVYFALLVLLWGLTEKELSIFQHLGILSFSLACVYMSAALKTQGSRELLKIRESKSA